jgi:hypothetical protein
MLLIGYVYALASATWLSLRAQAAVHVLLLLLIAKPASLEGKDPSQWVVMARCAPEISYLIY